MDQARRRTESERDAEREADRTGRSGPAPNSPGSNAS